MARFNIRKTLSWRPSSGRDAGVLTPVPHVELNGSFGQALRTEDIKFSPSGRLMAVVATNGGVSLLTVDTSARPVQIRQYAEMHSPSLRSPHGVAFLSEDVIAVANRAGNITFYRIPNSSTREDRMNVDPIHEMDSSWFGAMGTTRKFEGRNVLCGPGSVRVLGDELIVSCNNKSTVTAHPCRLQNGEIETGEGSIVAQKGLDIPDGVAVSRDGRWIAISNHQHHRAVVYRIEDTSQPCELRDPSLRFPHGICFDSTGRRLLVSDAGERNLHVFETTNEWKTPQESSAFSLASMSSNAFRRGKQAVPKEHRPLEGGVKGLDVDPSGRLVATTCMNQQLRFFEIQPIDSHLSL